MESLNNTDLNGRPIFVREDRESGAPNGGGGGAPVSAAVPRGGGGGGVVRVTVGTRVYVGNLAWDVAWQDLKDHMKKVRTL